MSDNRHFDQLVEKGHPIGEIVAIDEFIITIKGMQPASVRALIMFEDGSKGYLNEVRQDHSVVLYLGTNKLSVGMKAVVQHDELVTKVGRGFIGRVVNVFGDPLDGKGPIIAESTWPVFNNAPKLYEREALTDLCVTGVTVLDSLLPIVKGQRLAILGDSKSGKSELASQIAINQQQQDIVVIYALIAKRTTDVNNLLVKLNEAKVMDNCVVIVSTIFESLIASYLAPYVACSMGEYLWQKQNQDVMVIYDDLTSHAHVYREISLIGRGNPGRDSYPGDMFYAHSSLLERAGRLANNHKTFSALPIVLADNGDITAYLPTNIMSITDGQWILDMKVFRDKMRPAVNIGLSVTRVGGVGHNDRQKAFVGEVLKLLADYNQAQEFSHFGSELAIETQAALKKGGLLFQVFNQTSKEHSSIMAQMLMIDIILHAPSETPMDINRLKANAEIMAAKMSNDSNFDKVRDELYQSALVELKR